MTDLGQILTGLVQRTTEGKLKWSRSAQENQFVTSVDTISIVIIERKTLLEATYRLDILDELGEVVDSLGSVDTSESQDRDMARLYVLARRSAHNIDSTLEKLAKALDL